MHTTAAWHFSTCTEEKKKERCFMLILSNSLFDQKERFKDSKGKTNKKWTEKKETQEEIKKRRN